MDATTAVTKTTEIALKLKRMGIRYCAVVTLDFQKRFLIYDTEKGERIYNITALVPQDCILGPVLWKAAYDGVLRLKLPPDVKHTRSIRRV